MSYILLNNPNRVVSIESKKWKSIFYFFLITSFFLTSYSFASEGEIHQHYILEFNTLVDELPSKANPNTFHNNLSELREANKTAQVQYVSMMNQAAPTISVVRSFDTLINGVEVIATKHEITKLVNLSFVKRAYLVKKRKAHLDATHAVIKSPEAWSKVGGQSVAGKGMKIAIIDSGIQPANPMFSDEGFEPVADLNSEWLTSNPDYCRSVDGDPSFCNKKVIVARVFEPSLGDLSFPDGGFGYTPLDDNRHGTHVAGIAAGNPLQVSFDGVNVTLSGVAPGAYLMVYKALFDNGGFVQGTDGMLLKALEFAVNDGADVINNSWGSIRDEDPEDSVFANVFRVAEEMGVVIVSSAGNNGSVGGNAINCPGCIESGITVANSAHGRVFGHNIIVNDNEIPASSGTDLQNFSDINLPVRSLKALSEDTQNGCLPYDNASFSDSVILVEYKNNCQVNTIAQNAASAGAKAVLIYQDNLSYFENFKPFSQFTNESTIPILGISRINGDLIENISLSGSDNIKISGNREKLIVDQIYNQLNPGSSVGPNTNPGVLKPDVTAPGTDILSAAIVRNQSPFPFEQGNTFTDEDIAFAMISGTSMSSPAVAGAAALVKQANPSWSAKQVKTALSSTAKPIVMVNQKVASPFEQGSGLIQIDEAIDSMLTFSSSSHAIGSCVGTCSFTNIVTYTSQDEATWDIVINLDNANATFTSSHESITFSQGTPNTIQIDFSIDTTMVENSTWVFGSIDFKREGELTNRVPIALYANDNSDNRELSSSLTLTNDDTILGVTRVRNINLEDSPSVTISLPANASFVEDSISAEIYSGETNILELDELGRVIWNGSLSKGEMEITQIESLDLPSLKELGVSPVVCNNGCVDFTSIVDFDFQYNGETHNSLTISSNGFAIPGQIELGAFESNRVIRLPNQDSPNSIIAPLWNNYDLKDQSTPSDSGNGALFIDILTFNDEKYLVVEWNDVGLFGFGEEEGTESFTFQLLIKQNSDEIFFHYLKIPSFVDATIGAENSDATLGVTFHNGRDIIALPTPIITMPVTLQLTSTVSGFVDINYEVKSVEDITIETKPDSVELIEDTVTSIDILSNDNSPIPIVVRADLTDANRSLTAERLTLFQRPSLIETTVNIVSQPNNGTLSLNNGVVEYVPELDYFGMDTFGYIVSNENGESSSVTQVSIKVNGVNDVPYLEPISNITVDSGASVNVNATAIDVDGDSVTWQWEQISGQQISFNATGNSLTFVAPTVSTQTTLEFTVKVLDSESESVPKSFTVTIKPTDEGPKETSGGALFYLIVLMIGSLIFRNKRN